MKTKNPGSRVARGCKKTDCPFVIPVFIPHLGCPHRCVFCNQTTLTSTPVHPPSAREIRKRIHRFLGYRGTRRGKSQIAYFGGNFLGLASEDVSRLLETAAQFVAADDVDGIRFSTRPDTVDKARLDQIASFPVSTVELGVQSMDDRILRLARRGHTAADTQSAVAQLRQRGYEVGCQMMVGLPGDDDAGALASAHRIADLAPDFVRIYPTVVLEGSRLAAWYRELRYIPLALEPCIDLVKELNQLFCNNGIRVIRMGLQASPELDGGSAIVAGPYHPAFGHLVFARMFLERAMAAINALTSDAATRLDGIVLQVNPRDESRLRGLKNNNLAILQRTFPGLPITVLADANLRQGELKLAPAVSEHSPHFRSHFPAD